MSAPTYSVVHLVREGPDSISWKRHPNYQSSETHPDLTKANYAAIDMVQKHRTGSEIVWLHAKVDGMQEWCFGVDKNIMKADGRAKVMRTADLKAVYGDIKEVDSRQDAVQDVDSAADNASTEEETDWDVPDYRTPVQVSSTTKRAHTE